MFRVFVNSINSEPAGSDARRNTGTWIRIREEDRAWEVSARCLSFMFCRPRSIFIVPGN